MAKTIQISPRQTPCFRGLIQAETTEALFNAATDLATAEELAEEGIDYPPASVTIYRMNTSLNPGIYSTNPSESTVVTGYDGVPIDSAAFIAPETVEDYGLGYNFSYTPENRANFAFPTGGSYFADFLIFPKVGAAIAFRVGVWVE